VPSYRCLSTLPPTISTLSTLRILATTKMDGAAKSSSDRLKPIATLAMPDLQLKEESTPDPSSVVSFKRARSMTLLHEGTEPPCHLTRIPMELLAEILLYLPSTKCILAVARCSKYFCNTLVNNRSSVFIWRNVRAACKPYAIPNPTPNFTESAYAAFIFDGGECEVRGTRPFWLLGLTCFPFVDMQTENI